MAASTKPTSLWVSTYSDKNDQWVKARLEHLEGREKISTVGSIPRRKEIRTLRVELIDRKKAADAIVEALMKGVSPPVAPKRIRFSKADLG